MFCFEPFRILLFVEIRGKMKIKMADEFKTTLELDINSITDFDEIKRFHSLLQKQEVYLG